METLLPLQRETGRLLFCGRSAIRGTDSGPKKVAAELGVRDVNATALGGTRVLVPALSTLIGLYDARHAKHA